MDITIFGTLLVSLSGAAVFFVVVAGGAVAYVALTGTRALIPRAERLWLPAAAAGSGLGVLGLLFVRVIDGGAVAWLATVAVAAASGMAGGASVTLLAAVGARAQRALAARQRERRALLAQAEESQRQGAAAQRARLEAGDDIRHQTRQANAALDDLRAALSKVVAAQSDLENGAGPPSAERERLSEDLSARIDLGRRALGEAEAAVSRLRASEPLRVLVRRRPESALRTLSSAARGEGDLSAAAAAAEPAIMSFLDELRAARDACPEHGPEADARVREELDALETAYAPVLDRVRMLRVRLRADAGTADVASATSAVSAHTRGAGLAQTDVDALAVEVARADQALAITLAQEGDARELKSAVERGAVALAKSDDASLSELLGALRDLGSQ